MKACTLRAHAPVETNPLVFTDVQDPVPGPGEVLVRVRACAVCRTDLHVVEGELPPRKLPVIPGHQVVGTTQEGRRVGIAWLHRTCGECEYCLAGKENLCDRAEFTGYTRDGGYAEYAVVPEQYCYPIPDAFGDFEAAPLLCAGIIGFRTLRLSGIRPGQTLGMYGFGAAAHVAIQVARHWGVHVFAFTRQPEHRQLARELGADWAGEAGDPPPDLLDAAAIFAPAGDLVIAALRVLKKGGTVAIGGIHMTPIPAMDYLLLYGERVVRSVANNTRQDGQDFLRTAAEIPIRTETEIFPLADANHALQQLKGKGIRGAAVLAV